jgi:hypothetical protein
MTGNFDLHVLAAPETLSPDQPLNGTRQ